MTMQDQIDRVIERRAAEIVFWVNNGGETFAQVVARIKASSTLGPKSWERVISRANELLS